MAPMPRLLAMTLQYLAEKEVKNGFINSKQWQAQTALTVTQRTITMSHFLLVKHCDEAFILMILFIYTWILLDPPHSRVGKEILANRDYHQLVPGIKARLTATHPGTSHPTLSLIGAGYEETVSLATSSAFIKTCWRRQRRQSSQTVGD